MNLIWLKHVGSALLTTIFCCSAALAVAYGKGLRLPHGFDEAFTLTGIFFAALIATLIYLPAIRSVEGERLKFFRTWTGIVVLTVFVALLSSVGGGIVRGLITGNAT